MDPTRQCGHITAHARLLTASAHPVKYFTNVDKEQREIIFKKNFLIYMTTFLQVRI